MTAATAPAAAAISKGTPSSSADANPAMVPPIMASTTMMTLAEWLRRCQREECMPMLCSTPALVSSLPPAVPDPDTPPGDARNYPAVQLFLDGAEAAAPDRPVDNDAFAAVAVICRRLDGIPLALELAAARSRSLTPTELAERVKDRFAVLTTGSRTADARQQTLRATVD